MIYKTNQTITNALKTPNTTTLTSCIHNLEPVHGQKELYDKHPSNSSHIQMIHPPEH